MGVGQALGGSAQPQHPTLSTPARTTGLSESPGQAVVLGGPCVKFVKCYLKRDYNPATDTPTESSDRGAGRAHFGSTRTERYGGGGGVIGGESRGSLRIQRQVQGKAPDESRRSF